MHATLRHAGKSWEHAEYILVSISHLCHLLNTVSSPLQPRFNHSAVNAAKGKVMTSVSDTDSKGHSAALHTVTLLFITFMSCKWQRQWSQQCFLVFRSAVPLCPEFPPVQWRLAHFTSKNWGRRRKWWQDTRVNNEKTPAANMAHLPVCLNYSKPWKWGRFIFNIRVRSLCLLKGIPLQLRPLICSLALQRAGPEALPAAVPRSLETGVSLHCLSKCCSLC